MIDVKPEVYRALCEACPGASVSDDFPKEWKSFPKVTFTEELNAVALWTDDAEQFSRLRYRVDVWDKRDAAPVAAAVDAAMAALGFLRTSGGDVPVKELYKHKQMRYECIIDVKTGYVYHE